MYCYIFCNPTGQLCLGGPGYNSRSVRFFLILCQGHTVRLIKGDGYHLLCSFFKDREAFAALVREVASPDVGRMGIEILSFTIKDIIDHVSYLDSLGKTQTAKVKRDADIGVAESNRDAGIRVCQ